MAKIAESRHKKKAFEEAQKNETRAQMEEEENRQDGQSTPPAPVWDCGSPLYDSWELVAFTHHLDRNLMAIPRLLGGPSSHKITNDVSAAGLEVVPIKVDKGFAETAAIKGKASKEKVSNADRKKEKDRRKEKATCIGFWNPFICKKQSVQK